MCWRVVLCTCGQCSNSEDDPAALSCIDLARVLCHTYCGLSILAARHALSSLCTGIACHCVRSCVDRFIARCRQPSRPAASLRLTSQKGRLRLQPPRRESWKRKIPFRRRHRDGTSWQEKCALAAALPGPVASSFLKFQQIALVVTPQSQAQLLHQVHVRSL